MIFFIPEIDKKHVNLGIYLKAMTKKKNLIVFDIDDTLTKSATQHQLAYVNTMKAFEINKIDINWKNYAHHTDSYILSKNYEANLNKAFHFSFVSHFEEKMTEEFLLQDLTTEINGARDIVEFFNNETNYAISFATGSLLKPALIKLKQAGINYNENLVVSSNAIFEREAIVSQAISCAKSVYEVDDFENIISIGDGLWDLKTAQNLDLHFIGLGNKNLNDFQAENCKVTIQDFQGFDLERVEAKLGIRN